MSPETAPPPTPKDPGRVEFDRRWQRRLGRIRLGAEPIAEQLARYRRATWALTVVPTLIGAMFLGLFLAFRRPDVGALLVGAILMPIVAWAWFEDGRLRRRVARYLRERDELDRLGDP